MKNIEGKFVQFFSEGSARPRGHLATAALTKLGWAPLAASGPPVLPGGLGNVGPEATGTGPEGEWNQGFSGRHLTDGTFPPTEKKTGTQWEGNWKKKRDSLWDGAVGWRVFFERNLKILSRLFRDFAVGFFSS